MPGDKLISDTQFYSIGSSSAITLTVTIGNTQVGGSFVQYNNQQVFPAAGDPHTFAISGVSLATLLKVVTTCKDINVSTNVIPVTFVLSGGSAKKEYPYTATVDHDNAQAIFSIDFMFIN